jgi:hypothetical protein
MGLKIDKRETEFSKLFPQDMELYYDVMERYIQLTPEDFAGAYRLSQDALVMEDRFANLTASAGKLALSNQVSKANKSDIKDFCYRKLKIMEYIHEQARMVWNKGEQGERRKRVGT